MKSAPGIYRYASERSPAEGLRIGVARHLPRGVRREEWRKRGYFDLRLPLLAPSAELVKAYLGGKITWEVFARRYRAEMKKPECRQVIELLAGFARTTPFSVGCFCADETRCHRSLLRCLIAEKCAELPAAKRSRQDDSAESVERFSSPVCLAHFAENEDS